MPPFAFLYRSSLTARYPFLNAVTLLDVNVSSDGLGRDTARMGVGEGNDRAEGYDSRGPAIVTIEPNDVAGGGDEGCAVEESAGAVDEAEGKPFLAANNCFSFHHHNPNSTATLPPWANPNQCILSSGHLHSVVRYVTTLSNISNAGVGFGLGKSSPRGSKEVYH